jgi:ABC-type branched-subunit amino acid transport system ATPase component
MSILNVTDISKSYGGIRALAGCTMAFEEGAINGLIGPNGSGKTTLFNVISGYERADAGWVTFRGTDVTNARRRPSSRWASAGRSRSRASSRG